MKRVPFRLLVIVVAVVAGWWRFQGADLLERKRFYRFEPELWANSKPTDRYYMARYLVDRNELIGLSRDEVFAKLGRTEGDFYLLYNLGRERESLFKIDDDWLEVMISKSGVVTTRIRPD